MVRRLLIFAVISSFLPTIAISQQASAAAPNSVVFEELRAKVNGWRQTLQAIDIDRLTVGPESHSLLQGSRDSCLVWLQTLQNQVSRMRRMPSLSDQARLMLAIVQFQNATSNYSQELRRTAQASGAEAAGPANLPVKWMNLSDTIVSEIQAVQEGLQDTVERNMDAADKQLRECSSEARIRPGS